MLKQRIIARIGQLDSLENASRSLMFALRQWDMIVPGNKRGEYLPTEPLRTASRELEVWLLRVALCAHDADALPVADLLTWSALFPFQFTVSAFDLRQVPGLEIERHGGGLDIVRPA